MTGTWGARVKRTAVSTLVEIGCFLITPADPDGDGITMLPLLPDGLAGSVESRAIILKLQSVVAPS